MPDESVRIKPAGILLILLVVAGLLGLGAWWWKDKIFPPPKPADVKNVKPDAPSPQPSETPQAGGASEAADPTGITTVKEYTFVPAQVLPKVSGTSDYKALAEIGGK